MRCLIAKYTLERLWEQQVAFPDNIVNIPLKTGRGQSIALVSIDGPEMVRFRDDSSVEQNPQDETSVDISFRDLSSWMEQESCEYMVLDWPETGIIHLWNTNAQEETFGDISFRDLSSWGMFPVNRWSWNVRKQGWFTFGTQMPRTKRLGID